MRVRTCRESSEPALAEGWHGEMAWMAETAERRASPSALWPQVRSVIMVGFNYGPDEDPLERLSDRVIIGNISVYARNRDYHDIIKGRLKELAWTAAPAQWSNGKGVCRYGARYGEAARRGRGLGWQGKHTVLVSRAFGSWLFLGAIFTDLDLSADEAHPESCGTCTRCPRCPPNQGLPRAVPTRCAALHRLSQHRA